MLFFLLSLVFLVKLLSIPLHIWSNQGVAENQVTFLRIAPELKLIRAKYRGEEQAERILALYQRESYKPYLALKSTFVLLVQIPIFVWVFVGVSGSERVRGEQFWFIRDLALPDGLISFGAMSVNLLPFLMLFVSVGNLLHLSYLKRMAKSQLFSGWAIALGFFALLYSSASALVVYWTMNIVAQWLIDLFVNWRGARVRSTP